MSAGDDHRPKAAARLKGAVPPPVRDQLRRLRHRVRRVGEGVDWGNIRRTVPFSTWGSDGGVPVDRYYIDRFVEDHRIDVRGQVLEVGASAYVTRFGGSRVTGVDVLDVDITNTGATIVGDLSSPGVVPEAAFDTFLLLQTLQYVPDVGRALQHAWASLRPGGVLFISAPGLSRIDPADRSHDVRRFTPAGFGDALAALEGAELEVEVYGNVLAAVTYLLGISAEELKPAELAVADPDFPVTLCARVRRPGAA
jgi:SAM-dependent methyltransferase